jgi:SH3-like domain-containing protein
MKHQPFFAVFLLLLSMLACNLPSNAPGTPTATILATNTSAQLSTSIPINTALPSSTLPPALTFTPTVPVASPKDVAVNCRFGPGTAWVALSALNVGQSAQIVGKNSDGSWWYIVDPFSPGRNCWVSAAVINASGSVASIPVFEAPRASVTNTSVRIDPSTVSVTGCTGTPPVIKFIGTIEVNGPARVTWHFESQQGGTFSSQTTDFDAFGSRDVSMDYPAPLTAGTYWVRLVVTEPNSLQSEARYTIQC